MANAWGSSWGTSWGVSWGSDPAPGSETVSGSGHNYDNLDLSKWSRKKKRLQKQVQKLQQEVEDARQRLDLQATEKAIEAARAKIHSLQAKIMALLIELDELNKAKNEIEMREVLTAYIAYRELH